MKHDSPEHDWETCPDCLEQAVEDGILTDDRGPIIERKIDESADLADKQLLEDWRYEVANGDTRLGFVEWRLHQKEVAEDAAAFYAGKTFDRQHGGVRRPALTDVTSRVTPAKRAIPAHPPDPPGHLSTYGASSESANPSQ